ncbi:hypothetical protein [Tropicimonas aquimaris]|uniref:Uncharacterized protein n=1 Tax=Tropicimonas aquimaris TaxID=914152 RepID=A0ABW3IQ25_9RHOB
MKTPLTLLTLGTVMALSGCAYFNEEAGAFLDQGEFGNATMNNQLAQTCRKLTPANVTKYGTPLASNCPGRLQDGKYAMFAYEETITSATEQSSAAVEGTEEISVE